MHTRTLGQSLRVSAACGCLGQRGNVGCVAGDDACLLGRGRGRHDDGIDDAAVAG
jgi:hypothetical protein